MLKEGFKSLDIGAGEKDAVKHYWIDSYKQLSSKHFRYIKAEGKSRYERGERFSFFSLILQPVKAIVKSLIKKEGWKGGFVGIFLSIFFGYYIFGSIISLGIYEWKIKN